MSIESLLKNLTTAIEENTAALSGIVAIDNTKPAPAPAAEKKAAPAPPAKTEAAADTGSPTPTTAAPPPPTKTVTNDELNEILRKEFVRIGNTRDPIDKIMVDSFKVNSLHNLEADKYVELIKLVAAIPSV